MAVSFSNEVMEAMGFRQIAEGESVSVKFTYVHVYAAQGLALSSPGPLLLSGKVGGHSYNVAVAASVNEACKALVADDFAPDESAWSREHRCSPPYVLIAFGPTSEHICTSGHIKTEADGSVTTYDGFASARLELLTVESATLPQLLTALTCTFSSESQYVGFRPVDEAIAGTTPTSITVHDLRIQVSGTAYASTALPRDVVQTRLQCAADLASEVNTKVARFFQLALLEDDLLKRFLYFFLALEVETHAVFQSIDNTKHLSAL